MADGGQLELWPPGVTWHAISPRLLLVRRIGLGAAVLMLVAIGGVIAALAPTDADWRRFVLWAVVGAAALCCWLFAVAGRQVRAWGYAERDTDLLVRRGLLYRRLVLVPYGRMQFVDVHAGPVERLLGIATIRLHTAAAATDAEIPGLPTAEAGRLRDRLAALGEAKAAGL